MLAVLVALLCVGAARAQQVSVSRIDQMPNIPSPYAMRDWKAVARSYDSLVFDLSRAGTYLPLISLNEATVNYPAHGSFFLHTVVGTADPNSSEAINALPAIVGATLSGIDKSAQGGRNWVLMAEEWFNRRASQNVYKNHPVDDGGDDWWYETMPNVFFYQMNDLYPHTGDFDRQFTTVADRWLQAVNAMGGRTTPWQVPNMDHRGWFLQTMSPYDDGVHEPEAAGAIAWLLYAAYLRTGETRYRAGAEQAMEFLDGRASNPAYELQLPYGTYLAARMNAELGTTYNLEKMVNWCFDIGPLRSWGAVTGTWGGYDVSGLIGEVNGVNNYAFAMNTFEQIGCLVPMVRYDPRFARAIGKWTLNAANAARLFYPNSLPEDHQDSYQWSAQYDPASSIAHEALRQSQNGKTPFGTGDAISGGWGATTLALYGSSHAGILGGIIETTDVPLILKLDLLRTDYYRSAAYPSFLLFNPYAVSEDVTFDAGSGPHDLYDVVSKKYVGTSVSGPATISLAPDSAAIVVVIPSGGTPLYAEGKMLVGEVVVDYHSAVPVVNHAPRIKSLTADRTLLLAGDTARVYCTAVDVDGDTLFYGWDAARSTIVGTGAIIQCIAPGTAGTDSVTCIVNDGRGGGDTVRVPLSIVTLLNHPPVITQLTALPRKLDLGATATLHCTATDADGDSLSYGWSSSRGGFSGAGASVEWTAPDSAGDYVVVCAVADGRGGTAADSIALEVRDFSQGESGQLVAYYPFSGSAADSSGAGNSGVVHGATLVADRVGRPGSAYLFNGTTDDIQVPNSPSLNFSHSVTINFWINIGAFFTREQYPISHGNYQNRWKISISEKRLRWTVKTSSGIKDLDSETELVANKWYNATVAYNGADIEIYLDGALDAFGAWSGSILTTNIDLTIGQATPTESGYNFQGMLDDIRIYNYALSMAQIGDLVTDVGDEETPALPAGFTLAQNYPNPFNPVTTIRYGLPRQAWVTLTLSDILGRTVRTIVDETQEAGLRTVALNAGDLSSGVYFLRLASGTTQLTRKLLLLR